MFIQSFWFSFVSHRECNCFVSLFGTMIASKFDEWESIWATYWFSSGLCDKNEKWPGIEFPESTAKMKTYKYVNL